MRASLSCEDVSIRYEPDNPPVLRNVSFSIAPGEKIALLGLNGTGKTTLLSAMVGLVGFEGRISICGEALSRRSAVALRRKVGFLFNVPEDQLLFPTVGEDVAFGLLKSGVTREAASARVGRVLDRLGIHHLIDEPLHRLSHGQKQRVALAGAVVTHPPLLLLDEPTAGLDPPGKKHLADVLLGLESAELIATHDLDFADRVSSRVILLEQGTVACDARNVDDVRARWIA
jgi:cobalt/nickel transport system ATP-binding protein